MSEEEQKNGRLCESPGLICEWFVFFFGLLCLLLLTLLCFGTREITELTEGGFTENLLKGGTVEKKEEKGGIVSQLDLNSNNCSKGVFSMVKTSPHFSSNV